MNNSQEKKFKVIEDNDIIVGIDIAKNVHWGVIISPKGNILMKSFSFNNTSKGIKSLVANINKILMMVNGRKAIIGMEPTGHYWKALARNLKKHEELKVVTVNPYHVKKSKELDDNSQTKNDKKDCLTIARIVRDARFFEPYLPEGIWEELRVSTTARQELVKRENAIKNRIIGIQDEYFPEYTKVFKKILSRTSEVILKNCPFVPDIIEKGVEGIQEEIRKEMDRGYRKQQIMEIYEMAQNSIGKKENIESAREHLKIYMEESELIKKQKKRIENRLEELLHETGYYTNMISIKGIGVVTAAMFLGEVGEIKRFNSYEQIRRYAGLNLIENSSGTHKGTTKISKRGRATLRSVLYLMACNMVNKNEEIKKLYKYLTTRKEKPLKKKQALIAIEGKIIQIIYVLTTKNLEYKAARVFNPERLELLQAA